MPRISSPLARLLRAPRPLAILSVLAAMAADVVIKRLVLARSWDGRTLIPGLLDTHYAWNRGVSFSLLWQSTSLGSVLLSLLLLAIIVVFLAMALRATRPLVAAGFGVIVGGALGNMIDRASHGAVFDFLVVRFGAHPFFVCNPADVFISLGVIALAADALLDRETGKPA